MKNPIGQSLSEELVLFKMNKLKNKATTNTLFIMKGNGVQCNRQQKY